VALLEAAGLRADGLASFFRKLKPEESQGILPDWLASHPGLAERIAATDRPATGMHALDTEKWRALKAVCAKDATGASTGDTDEESTAPDAGAGTSTTTAPSGSTTENAPASGGNAQQGKPRKSVP
jgi:predicted Zn-dependent protease